MLTFFYLGSEIGSASSARKVSYEWLDTFLVDNVIEQITETMPPSLKTIIAANK